MKTKSKGISIFILFIMVVALVDNIILRIFNTSPAIVISLVLINVGLFYFFWTVFKNKEELEE